MADVKISALPLASTPLAGTEVLPIVQSATTTQVSIANVTAGRSVSAASLTLTTTPLAVGSGGTGVTTSTGSGAVVLGTTPTFTTSALFPAGTVSAPGISVSGDTNTGIYFPAADTIGFVEGGVEAMRITSTGTVNIVGAGTAGSTQAVSLNGSAPINSMVLDASGNLGIGTSSPGYKLDVNGATTRLALATTGFAFSIFTNTGGNLYCGLDTSSGGSLSSGSSAYAAVFNHTGAYSMQFGTSNTIRMTLNASGNLGIGEANPSYAKFIVTSTGGAGISIAQGTENFYGASSHKFFNEGYTTPRMTLDNSGNLLVNTVARTASERMALWYSSNTGPGLNIRDTNPQNGNTFIQFNNGATTAGSITSNGTTTTTYGSGSDYRLKTNIRPMENALTRVNELKPSSYTWIDSEEFGEGFIAHELQAIFPLAVVGEKDGEKMQQVDYGKLTPLLAAAIQELAAKVAELEAKL